jgi:hypothetical protein
MILSDLKYNNDLSEEVFYYSLKTNDDNLFLFPNIIKTIYHTDKKKLEVVFIKNRVVFIPQENKKVEKVLSSVYLIENVDYSIYEELKNSESQGNYYNAFIKKYNPVVMSFNLIDEEVKDVTYEWNLKMSVNGLKTIYSLFFTL